MITVGGGRHEPDGISRVCGRCKCNSNDPRVYGKWVVVVDRELSLCYPCYHNLKSYGKRLRLLKEMKEKKNIQQVKTEAPDLDNTEELNESINNNEEMRDYDSDENAEDYEELCNQYPIYSSSSSSSSASEKSLPKPKEESGKRPRRPGPEELNNRTPILQRLRPNPKTRRSILCSDCMTEYVLL